MKFGPVDLLNAKGAILAHSLRLGDLRLRKGDALTSVDIAALAEAGVAQVTVAILEPDDLGENDAAAQIGAAGVIAGIEVTKAFAGRVNLIAQNTGVLVLDTKAVDAVNAIDPAITLATLPQYTRVDQGQMLATLKIIPYGVDRGLVEQAARKLAGAIQLNAVQKRQVSLVLSEVSGMKKSLLEKGRKAIEARLARLGVTLFESHIVAHQVSEIAEAIKAAKGELVLVLGGSATSDIHDVAPEAVRRAGGHIERFGIPVDPGNLLFIGKQNGRDVLGLPGCARALALNGADWVLERLICGVAVDSAMLAGMGVGGLLKEIPTRPQPRKVYARPEQKKVAVILLASGQSSRMRGRDKLLEMVGGQTMVRHAAQMATKSKASQVYAILPPNSDARRGQLEGLDVNILTAPDFAEGMGASLRNAMSQIGGGYNAVIVTLADMPEVTSAHFNALIDAYDPAKQRDICRAYAGDTPGHPVLFGQRFFESLAGASGDSGGRDILRGSSEYVFKVKTSGRGAVLDLDTPEAWDAWRADP